MLCYIILYCVISYYITLCIDIHKFIDKFNFLKIIHRVVRKLVNIIDIFSSIFV